MKNIFLPFIFITTLCFSQNKEGIKTETVLEGVDSIIHNYNPLGKLTETKYYKNRQPYKKINYSYAIYLKTRILDAKYFYFPISIWETKMDSVSFFMEDEWGDPTIPEMRYQKVKIPNTKRIVFDTVPKFNESFRENENQKIKYTLFGTNPYWEYRFQAYNKEVSHLENSLVIKKEKYSNHIEREFLGRYDTVTIMMEDEWGDPTIPAITAYEHMESRVRIDSIPSIITTYKYDKESRLLEKQTIVKSNYDGDDEFIKVNSEQNYLYQYSYKDRLKIEKIFMNGFLKEERIYKTELLVEKIKYLSSSKELKYNYSYKTDKKGNVISVIENGKVLKTAQYEYYPLSNLGGE